MSQQTVLAEIVSWSSLSHQAQVRKLRSDSSETYSITIERKDFKQICPGLPLPPCNGDHLNIWQTTQGAESVYSFRCWNPKDHERSTEVTFKAKVWEVKSVREKKDPLTAILWAPGIGLGSAVKDMYCEKVPHAAIDQWWIVKRFIYAQPKTRLANDTAHGYLLVDEVVGTCEMPGSETALLTFEACIHKAILCGAVGPGKSYYSVTLIAAGFPKLLATIGHDDAARLWQASKPLHPGKGDILEVSFHAPPSGMESISPHNVIRVNFVKVVRYRSS